MKKIEQRRMVLPFEQQPRESDKAFAAFSVYLNLGPQRSLSLTAKQLGKSKTLMEEWSRKFEWQVRVKAYAAHLAETERLAIERLAVEKAVEWHRLHEPVKREAWQEAVDTIAMVRKARREWMEKGRLPGWEGMARMLELAFKLKQFAVGLPSEVKEVNTHVTGTIDVEWEKAIRKAYGVEEEIEGPKPEVQSGQVVDVEEVKP